MGRPRKEMCVYRYVDKNDGIVKYVGIVYNSTLERRIAVHKSMDPWALGGNWRIEYFECESRAEVEAFEAHLIALYGTDKYYNKAKKSWGINRFLPDVEGWWNVAEETTFEDKLTWKLSLTIKALIKRKMYKEVRELLDEFVVIEVR